MQNHSPKNTLVTQLVSDLNNKLIDADDAKHIAQLLLIYFPKNTTPAQFTRLQNHLVRIDSEFSNFISRYK